MIASFLLNCPASLRSDVSLRGVSMATFATWLLRYQGPDDLYFKHLWHLRNCPDSFKYPHGVPRITVVGFSDLDIETEINTYPLMMRSV